MEEEVDICLAVPIAEERARLYQVWRPAFSFFSRAQQSEVLQEEHGASGGKLNSIEVKGRFGDCYITKG